MKYTPPLHDYKITLQQHSSNPVSPGFHPALPRSRPYGAEKIVSLIPALIISNHNNTEVNPELYVRKKIDPSQEFGMTSAAGREISWQ